MRIIRFNRLTRSLIIIFTLVLVDVTSDTVRQERGNDE